MEFLDSWFTENQNKEDVWRRSVFGVFLKKKLQRIRRWRALTRGKSAKGGRGR